MKLFRKEVIDNLNSTTNGGVIISTSFNLFLSTIATIILMILISIFLGFGEYTSKARLTGIVMPSSGLIKITPQYSGYVTKLTVQEGEHVQKGQALYHISGEHYSSKGTVTLAAINLSLQTQHSMLSSQKMLEQRDNNQQQQAVQQHIALIQLQIKSGEQRLLLAKHQADLSSIVASRYQKLITQKYVSEIEYQLKQIESSSAKENVENQRQLLLQLRASLDNAKDELAHLIVQGESRNAELNRQLQIIKQQQFELASQENFTLTAPVSGTVVVILVRQGQSVKAQEPVMSLVPENSDLQIELYATSQNAGFIHPGQKVALRYTAFPYQKFGVQYGTIIEISRITLAPTDLLSISPMIWKVNEGHYRVIVKPELSHILAYGKYEPLRPGMTLEGDVNLDTRYLWEWLTEPLWSLKGKF